jgi:hypothetical protein
VTQRSTVANVPDRNLCSLKHGHLTPYAGPVGIRGLVRQVCRSSQSIGSAET